MPKIMFLQGCYLALRSRSKVGVKVIGRGQGQRSGSRSNFRRAAVDNRGSALPSAAKSKKSHYQFKVFVYVSVISGRMRIIARMRSIGVLLAKANFFVNVSLFNFLRSFSLGRWTCANLSAMFKADRDFPGSPSCLACDSIEYIR